MRHFILDAGNASIKAKSGKSEASIPHALIELREDEWQAALMRSRNQHDDLVCVNGKYYAAGERAEHYQLGDTRITGAKRYTREYYGVIAAIMMARIFKHGEDVYFFGSHPPGDWMYADDLLASIDGTWEVMFRERSCVFNIENGLTFEEPRGGLMNLMLKPDGTLDDKGKRISDGTSFVIDIGGMTTDLMRIEKLGQVDEQSARSVPLGILATLEQFWQNVRATHADLLKGVNVDAEVIRDALRTGKLDTRGLSGFVNVQDEADYATRYLVNQIGNLFDNSGGAAAFHNVILTGGGGALLHEPLKQRLGHKNILLAETRGKMHLANVRGGEKLFKLYERKGLL